MVRGSRLVNMVPEHLDAMKADEDLTACHADVSEAIGLAFNFCARHVERVRLQRERGYGGPSDFEEIRKGFNAMLALLRTDAGTTDDREGVLHRLMDDFLNQLNLLVPNPAALK